MKLIKILISAPVTFSRHFHMYCGHGTLNYEMLCPLGGGVCSPYRSTFVTLLW